MALKAGLKFQGNVDQIVGLEDFGISLGRSRRVANQALVFMVRGLTTKWKQPIAYFLTCDAGKSISKFNYYVEFCLFLMLIILL